MSEELIAIEVVYALPERQHLMALTVAAGCSVREAARRSGIAQQFPELDLATAPLGIFGKLVPNPDEVPVRTGDRVEIYRPLLIDPKVVRRLKAEEARQILQAQRRKR